MTTLRCMLEETSRISRHRAGAVQGDRIILYSEWDDWASAVASRLRASGVVPGDRVAVFMANDWRALLVVTGIIRAGAVACPLSIRLPRAAVLSQVAELGARHVVAQLSGEAPEDLAGLSVLSPLDLVAVPEEASRGSVQMDMTAPAVILYTSGSTGRPRPAVLTYGNLYYNALGANANLHVSSTDKWLLNLPLYHVSGIGILMRCLLGGATVAIPEGEEDLPTAIERYRPTHLSVVPAQLSDLLALPDMPAMADLRVLLVGGSRCDPVLLEQARSRRWPVYATYGMTEMGSQIATMPPDAPPAKRSSTCGRALRHREITVDDDGEILVRGPCLFSGYWHDGDVIPAVAGAGWFATGDLGRIDADGYLSVTGRKDFLIISGGENIQPEEIEQVLLELPDIEKALVVPVPDDRFGQRPVAFIKAAFPDDGAWRSHLAERLPRFKIPDAFYPWPDELPGDELKLPRSWFAGEALRRKS